MDAGPCKAYVCARARARPHVARASPCAVKFGQRPRPARRVGRLRDGHVDGDPGDRVLGVLVARRPAVTRNQIAQTDTIDSAKRSRGSPVEIGQDAFAAGGGDGLEGIFDGARSGLGLR